MKLALYKGTRPGLSGWFNRLTRWWCRGPYSHAELVFSDGMSASSSLIDGGVRFKTIEYSAENWDFIELNHDDAKAREWFEKHQGAKFDSVGILRFGFGPLKDSRSKFFCSESIMSALGYAEAWRFDPCLSAVVFKNKVTK